MKIRHADAASEDETGDGMESLIPKADGHHRGNVRTVGVAGKAQADVAIFDLDIVVADRRIHELHSIDDVSECHIAVADVPAERARTGGTTGIVANGAIEAGGGDHRTLGNAAAEREAIG